MYLLKLLCDFISYPVEKFWLVYEKNKEKNSFGKNLLLFAGSFIGVLVLFGLLAWFLLWLLSTHFEIVLFVVAVYWFYMWVHSRLQEKIVAKQEPVKEEMECKEEKEKLAVKTYPLVRNILYITLKGMADHIAGQIPRVIQEIELPDCHYIISPTTGITTYQFKLAKADIQSRCTTEELQAYKEILQNAIGENIRCGRFPNIDLQYCIDDAGNVYDPVIIRSFEDLDAFYIIGVVLYSKDYVAHQRNLQITQQENGAGLKVEEW